MPKNSQYGRWRRAAMQAVLWVVFGGTLALAGYVSHRRTSSFDTQLAERTSFGPLRLRLPRGWDREDDKEKKEKKDDKAEALVLKERDEEGRPRRSLWITHERQASSKRGPAYYLETTYLKSSFELPPSQAEPFPFLGGRGVLLEWRGVPRGIVELEELGVSLPDPGLYACTVRPDGLTVTVQIRGEGAFGPSNRRLIRQVADGITLADTPAGPEAKPQNP